MAFPIVALATFGVYAYAIYWYAIPGAGYLPEGKVNVPEWIGDLSLALPVVATVLYLSMCYFGPKIMARREAFDPKGFMLVYNGYQTFFNVVTVALFVAELRRLGVSAWGGRLSWTDPESFWICLGIWLHYNNKYLELLDTVFMVVRKKSDQLSFLHVYHHCLLIWAWWMVCFVIKNNDCVDSYFGACMNAGIHVIMYSYYLMRALSIACPWKKYITMAQMAQFAIVFAHAVFVVVDGHCPAILPYSQMFVMTNMLVLFGRFYVGAYGEKKDAKKKKAR
jgi:elongation of very long chain fatty acids protein 4|tara:strand:+ start:128 stop:964 length:837 start_codon:yes stop_codon:yes gene_type:complete